MKSYFDNPSTYFDQFMESSPKPTARPKTKSAIRAEMEQRMKNYPPMFWPGPPERNPAIVGGTPLSELNDDEESMKSSRKKRKRSRSTQAK